MQTADTGHSRLNCELVCTGDGATLRLHDL